MKKVKVVSIIVVAVLVGVAIYYGIGKSSADSVTSKIVDAGFEGNVLNGGTWNLQSNNTNQNNLSIKEYSYASANNISSDEGKKCVSYSFVDGSSFFLTQKLQNVAAGTYELKVDALGEDSEICVYLDGVAAGKKRLTGASKWGTASSKYEIDSDKKDVTVGVYVCGDLNGWGYFDNISMVKTSNEVQSGAVDSDIYVEKVNGIDDNFIKGADISSYASLIESGVTFKDWSKKTVDDQGFFNLLASSGINYVRLRIWNNPYSSSGIGYGGGNCDLDKAITLGQYAKKAGLKVMIDLQYSDFWADSSSQNAPKEWEKSTIEEKETKVTEFTKDVIKQLTDRGINIGMIQIGNETNNGIAGETEWENMCKIFSAGSDAVKQSLPNTKVALHFSNANTTQSYADIAKKLNDSKVNYDVFAVSYFPHINGTLTNLTQMLESVASTYNKQVCVAETSYAYTYSDGDGQANTINGNGNTALDYPVSVQGQATAIRNVCKAVADVSNNAGIGVFYFEPAWIPVQNASDKDGKLDTNVVASNKDAWEKFGCGFASSYAKEYDSEKTSKIQGGTPIDNQALFDFSGMPLESLNVFKYITTGTKKAEQFIGLSDTSRKVLFGHNISLPETITANFNTGQTKQIDVKWDNVTDNKVGRYDVKGVANYNGKNVDAVCKLTILPVNSLKNADFENGNNGEWMITGSGVSIAGSQNGEVQNGNYSLQFGGNANYSYNVSQKISGLEKGNYILHGYVQGQKASQSDICCVVITSGGKTYKCDAELNGRGNWNEVIIHDVPVVDGNIQVDIKGKGVRGSFGSWDDFYLNKSDGSDFDPTKESVLNQPLEQEMDFDALATDDGILARFSNITSKCKTFFMGIFSKVKEIWHMIFK